MDVDERECLCVTLTVLRYITLQNIIYMLFYFTDYNIIRKIMKSYEDNVLYRFILYRKKFLLYYNDVAKSFAACSLQLI